MTAFTSLEHAARQALRRRWVQAGSRAATTEEAAEAAELFNAADRVLPDLIQIVSDHRDQSPRTQRTKIRRMLLEHTLFVGDCDCPIHRGGLRRLEEQVDLVVEVLEEVRSTAIHQGEWSSAPVTPIMFG